MPQPRHRAARRLALGAAAGALAAPLPAAPVRADPPLVEECWTETLTPEQVEAGQTNEIWCDWVPASARALPARRAYVVAVHHDGFNASGASLSVSGSCGGRLNIAPGDTWDDRISSTRYTACGQVKHYVGAAGGGAHQLTTGVAGQISNLSAPVNDQVSSVDYG